jgi:hypothetical protein
MHRLISGIVEVRASASLMGLGDSLSITALQFAPPGEDEKDENSVRRKNPR